MKSLLLCLLILAAGQRAFAQHDHVYPESADLRKKLLELIAEKPEGFQNIKADLAYKKGTASWYHATLHLTAADTPRVVENTQPLQIYYLDFLANGISVFESKVVFEKWLNLLQMVLPEYNMRVSGDQFVDMEGFEFSSPDGTTVFYLYRKGSGNACQVALTIINDNADALRQILDKEDDEDE